MSDKTQRVTIIPPESRDGLTRTQGTRVVLEDGTELEGVEKVTLTAVPNSLWRAAIELQPKMGVMKGMHAQLYQGRSSWWRTLLCRMAGVILEDTDVSYKRVRNYRKPGSNPSAPIASKPNPPPNPPPMI